MTASAIIGGIVGIIKAIPIIDSWFGQLVAAWMAMQTQKTLSGIADAAALGARAATDTDRFKAAEKWREALSQPRYIP